MAAGPTGTANWSATMKKMILAAIAALSLGVGSAYAAQTINQAPGVVPNVVQQSMAGGAG
jgi:hypothetical protein